MTDVVTGIEHPKVVHLRDVFSSPGQYTINQNPIQR